MGAGQSGGVVEENGFMSSHSESTILSFSVTGKVFSRGGNQVLINIKIVPEDSHICIEDYVGEQDTSNCP